MIILHFSIDTAIAVVRNTSLRIKTNNKQSQLIVIYKHQNNKNSKTVP